MNEEGRKAPGRDSGKGHGKGSGGGPGKGPGEAPPRIDLNRLKVRSIASKFRPKRLKVGKDTPLSRLVELLVDHPESDNIYVVDGKERLLGIVTFHELLKVIWAKFGLMDKEIFDQMEFLHYAYSTTAGEIMAPAVSVTGEDSIHEAVRLMAQHRLNDIPVVDEGGRVIEEVNDRELLAYGRKVIKGNSDDIIP